MNFITHLGDPILRKQAAPITDVFSKETEQIIDKLVSTLIKERGIGISGPQVGILKQILKIFFIMQKIMEMDLQMPR